MALGLAACSALAWALTAPPMHGVDSTRQVYGPVARVRMEFGDNDYTGAEPGTLPKGSFEIALKKPLGIQFEEDGPVIGKSGVSIIGFADGGNAAKDGSLQVGDKLVGVTAVKIQGAKFERQMFDARKFDFDTVVDAIGSNEEKFGCYDVILQFWRPPIKIGSE